MRRATRIAFSDLPENARHRGSLRNKIEAHCQLLLQISTRLPKYLGNTKRQSTQPVNRYF
jgi:hypothetical protein